MQQYRVKQTDRTASQDGLELGQIVYPGNDGYGCASDDTRLLGIDYVAVSHNQSGEPFLTIPAADIERIEDL